MFEISLSEVSPHAARRTDTSIVGITHSVLSFVAVIVIARQQNLPVKICF